jgi:hypothetical protein
LNCKSGDLALIVRGEETGKMVTCIRLEDPGCRFRPELRGCVWLIDRELEWTSNKGNSYLGAYCPDEYLMPIRPDGDGAAEIGSELAAA